MERIRDLERYVCLATASVRAAMERLNSLSAGRQFQVITDENGHLLGTVTDGDVRRAILRSISLEDRVTRCMNEQPIVGRINSDAENLAALSRVIAHSAFLPIIDTDGVLREILLREGVQQGVTALIMAGGFGRRLGERTRETPKPLLPIGNKPILEHILARLESANTSRVFISVHYLAEQIESFVARRANRVPVAFVRERQPLGTAGAIGLLPETAAEPIMVLNGDILTTLDFTAFQEFHERHDYDATIAVAQHQVTIPYGVIRHGSDGQFLGIDEKPTFNRFVAAGIYLLSPRFRALIRSGESLDMPALIERGRSVDLRAGLFPVHEYWTDVGRPEDLERAAAQHPEK